jgi:hypothetical protein
MTKIEQVREALEAAKHAMTNQRYLLPRLGMEDAHAKVTSAIAILKDMDGQEPVAKDAMPTYDAGLLSNYGGGDVEWWQDYIRAELNRADDFYQSWWQSAHPSPSAPVDIAEIIEKGDQAIRMWHEELKADGWDSSTSLDLASGDWTTATAKHRTA